jgi:hypothetical protein
MGLTALCIATACYAVAAADLARQGNVLMAIVWAAYAVANAALTRASFPKQIDAIVRAWL